jgi:hypothetical protein
VGKRGDNNIKQRIIYKTSDRNIYKYIKQHYNMKQKQTKGNGVLIIWVITIIFVLVASTIFINQSRKQVEILREENNLFRELLYVDVLLAEASVPSQKANDYYTEAGISYERSDYRLSESNCRLARGYYSEASQKYLNARAHLKELNSDDDLINTYIEMLGYLSEMKLNLFEACEHFESASRHYDYYFKPTTPHNDVSFDMGGKEIERMNEKVREHDENIRKYNSLLSEFGIKLKNRLK